MTDSLSVLSMIFLGISAAAAAVIPFILLIIFKKKGAEVVPFFIGFAVFVLFALVIEGAINYLVLNVIPAGKALSQNTLFIAIYGGLMAGLFEETGRYIAFKTVLKKRLGNDMNALSYGAGHGGIEAIMTLSVTYLAYIVIALMMRSDTLVRLIPEEAMSQLAPVMEQLAAMPAVTILAGLVERCIAITLHICLSVMVWFAAKRKKSFLLYPAAILCHAFLDAVLVILSRTTNLSTFVLEGILALLVIVMVFITIIIWKKQKAVIAFETVPEEVPAEEVPAEE